jgi:hypothetical protein
MVFRQDLDSDAGVQITSFDRMYDPFATTDLCNMIESRDNQLRAEYSVTSPLVAQSLQCAQIPPKFVDGDDVATANALEWTDSEPTWTENPKWNLFGASSRGDWTFDFRARYRALNEDDGCYDALVNFSTMTSASTGYAAAMAAAKTCLNTAFLSPSCVTAIQRQQAGDTSIAASTITQCQQGDVPARVGQFVSYCRTTKDTASSGPLELLGDQPPDCDRVCGTKCQALKGKITGLNVNVYVRSSSATTPAIPAP